jgi:hypothetical protein
MIVDRATLATLPAKDHRLIMVSAVNHRAPIGLIVKADDLRKVTGLDDELAERLH